MPLLTDVQSYAAGLMRSLLCLHRGQMHWMIQRKYPAVTPEKVMRQLGHVLRIYDDGEYYLWPGTQPNPERTAAVEAMLTLSKGSLPVIGEVPRPPCALLFFVPVPRSAVVLAYRVYVPKEGEETECRAIAESKRKPQGHAVVFLIRSRSQVPLLRVSHPHIFALQGGDGTYEFIEANI